jgi:nucleotide-binding universal stress UspA family protein
MPRERLEEVLKEQEYMHTEALSELLSHYDMAPDDSNVHCEKSDAAPLITGIAKDLPADLIVTGTVGRTGIPGFFIGNMAESLMQALDMAVLTVKSTKFVSPVTLS